MMVLDMKIQIDNSPYFIYQCTHTYSITKVKMENDFEPTSNLGPSSNFFSRRTQQFTNVAAISGYN